MLQRGKKRHRSDFSLKGKVIFFATNNFHKFDEARSVLTKRGIAVGMLRVKALEIQSDSLGEIAQASVISAFNRCHLPVMVEDAGLFVETLKGFPGPYAAYVYKTIGNLGLLKLMEGLENRKATFQSAIAYFDGQSEPVCFMGEVVGTVTNTEKRGEEKAGFGFDPIFQPSGRQKTFAEMNLEEKNSFSHRAKAVSNFAEWYERFRIQE
jgi:XTP/dITP diphosphohydrolase